MKTRNVKAELGAAIAEHFPVPGNIQKLVNQLNTDLYYGPLSVEEGEYPGFHAGCEIVSDWADENVSEVWVDLDCGCVMDREPDSGEEIDGEWVEYYMEETYHLERREVLAHLFGKELPSYL